jgi:hypothetical protein
MISSKNRGGGGANHEYSLNKKPVLHLDSSGEIYNTVLKNAEEPHALVRSTMEYGSIIWDPYTQQEITKLESIQRRGARFITKDYKSREEGCMTKMLNELNLPYDGWTAT